MIERILAATLITAGLIGLVAAFIPHYKQIDLMFRGEQVEARISAITADGERSINRSRSNYLSDIPKSVKVFKIKYIFKTARRQIEDVDRLTYYEIKDLTGEDLILYENRYQRQLLGSKLQIKYLITDPARNVIVRPLSFEEFYLPLFAGSGFILLGFLMFRGRH